MYGEVRRDLVRNEFKEASWIYVYNCGNCYLLFFDPKVPGSPAFYESLQSFEWYYPNDKAEYEMATKWIPLTARVLEVGCGAGWFAKKLSNSQYIGLEYSETAAEMARANGYDVRTQSVQEHSYANKSAYQIVCAFQVLEHVPDPGAFIAACLDCLEPGGLLIYAVPSNDCYLKYLQNDYLNLPPHHITRWQDNTLEAITKMFPISLVSIEHENVSDIHLRTCINTMMKRRLDLLLHRSETIVDHSLNYKLLYRFSSVLARCILEIFSDAVFRPRGHTVIAVYRKQVPSIPV